MPGMVSASVYSGALLGTRAVASWGTERLGKLIQQTERRLMSVAVRMTVQNQWEVPTAGSLSSVDHIPQDLTLEAALLQTGPHPWGRRKDQLEVAELLRNLSVVEQCFCIQSNLVVAHSHWDLEMHPGFRS